IMTIVSIVINVIVLIYGAVVPITDAIYTGVFGAVIAAIEVVGIRIRHVWVMMAFMLTMSLHIIYCFITAIVDAVWVGKFSDFDLLYYGEHYKLFCWLYIAVLFGQCIFDGILVYFYFKARKEIVDQIYRDAFANPPANGGMIILPAY
ncbi:hypothetical protein PMAYCL1PPCAC_19839, partial [Pristionchus mayeri]